MKYGYCVNIMFDYSIDSFITKLYCLLFLCQYGRRITFVSRMNTQEKNMKLTIWRNWKRGKCVVH
jgi:hypothetical protein